MSNISDTDPRRVAVVIEDDEDIRNLLETVLTQAGFQVIAASNGITGIEAVRRYSPIVTTLDVNMPGLDGFETLRRIREFSETYVVMLTALGEEIDTLHGLESGADDYVTKPFRPRELRARIEAMLRRPRSIATDTAPRVASPVSPFAPSILTLPPRLVPQPEHAAVFARMIPVRQEDHERLRERVNPQRRAGPARMPEAAKGKHDTALAGVRRINVPAQPAPRQPRR